MKGSALPSCSHEDSLFLSPLLYMYTGLVIQHLLGLRMKREDSQVLRGDLPGIRPAFLSLFLAISLFSRLLTLGAFSLF